ncbi:MAG: trypsin-like serine peptidase, partial [Candidatus Methylomirabilaceae bacterium]
MRVSVDLRVILFPVLLLVCSSIPGLAAETGALPEGAPGVFGDDGRVTVDSAVWPWQAIGLLQRKAGGACTATLISENAVLTAAHCLFDRRGGRQLAPSEVRFLAGYRDGKAVAAALAQGFILHSNHGQSAPTIKDMQTDWAIVVLRKPLLIRPLPLRALPSRTGNHDPAVGWAVARAGYSEDRPTALSVDPSCRVLHRDVADRFLFTDCDTLKGDSGSPLLAQGSDEPAVIGVVSGLLEDDRGRP